MYFRGKSEVKGQYVSFPPPPKRIKKAELLWSKEPGVPYLLCFPMPLSSPPYPPPHTNTEPRSQAMCLLRNFLSLTNKGPKWP